MVVNSLGVVAAQLFAPYGQARWASGTMPTSYAFTGQRADSTTGLDYYGARYYDPAAGIFISADTASGKGAGLNRYAYVSGNPETLTDPTGHYMMGPGGGQGICKYHPDGPECQGGGGGGHGGGGNSGSCRTDASCGSYIGETPTCPGGATSCGIPGVHNSGKSLLRTYNVAKNNSDVLVGKGTWGLQDIINALQLLWDNITQGKLDALVSPGGSSLGGALVIAGVASFVSTLLGAIGSLGPVGAGLALAGNLLSATINLAALGGASTGSTWDDTGQAILGAITQLENFKTQFQEAGGNLDALTFTVTENDTYHTYYEYEDSWGDPLWLSDSEIQQRGTPDPSLYHLVYSYTDPTQIASATFSVDYYYQS